MVFSARFMLADQLKALEQTQRVKVDMERAGPRACVKVRVESYDENLGWYTAGSLSFPLCQLPLLEQAIQAMRTQTGAAHGSPGKIIPFPKSLTE